MNVPILLPTVEVETRPTNVLGSTSERETRFGSYDIILREFDQLVFPIIISLTSLAGGDRAKQAAKGFKTALRNLGDLLHTDSNSSGTGEASVLRLSDVIAEFTIVRDSIVELYSSFAALRGINNEFLKCLLDIQSEFDESIITLPLEYKLSHILHGHCLEVIVLDPIVTWLSPLISSLKSGEVERELHQMQIQQETSRRQLEYQTIIAFFLVLSSAVFINITSDIPLSTLSEVMNAAFLTSLTFSVTSAFVSFYTDIWLRSETYRYGNLPNFPEWYLTVLKRGPLILIFAAAILLYIGASVYVMIYVKHFF